MSNNTSVADDNRKRFVHLQLVQGCNGFSNQILLLRQRLLPPDPRHCQILAHVTEFADIDVAKLLEEFVASYNKGYILGHNTILDTQSFNSNTDPRLILYLLALNLIFAVDFEWVSMPWLGSRWDFLDDDGPDVSGLVGEFPLERRGIICYARLQG
ncbi:hypothetical protein K438DRAFT_1767689 [Mycena galopus ATCC 62051]|nr:hypothetical protein K438DRAFT_1767689 [Mycena galopus ATCC 62051]